MKLINDLFNMLLDQSNYETLVILRTLNKRQTAYATKYSLLGHYDVSVDLDDIFKTDKIKAIKQITTNLAIDDESSCFVFRNILDHSCGANKSVTHQQFMDCVLHSCATQGGNPTTVKYLVEMGASFDTYNAIRENRTRRLINDSLFSNCVKLGYFDIVKYLMSIGVNIFVNNAVHVRNTVFACVKTNRLTIIKYLVTNFCYHCSDFIVKHKPVFDDAVAECARFGSLEMLEYLKSIGANVNDIEALVVSMTNNRLDLLRFLVENGADIRAGGDDWLSNCASRGYLNMTKYLISIGLNVNKRAVIRTALNGHLMVVDYLISAGATIDDVEWLIGVCESRGHRDVAFYLRKFIL